MPELDELLELEELLELDELLELEELLEDEFGGLLPEPLPPHAPRINTTKKGKKRI